MQPIKPPALQKPIWEDTSAILRNIQGKPQNLSLQQIRDAIISNSSKLTTFRANIAMTLTAPDLKGPVRCTGLILYQNPKSLRAMGSKFATTMFDISSDGNKFWLYVPLENKVYTGACNTFHKIEALGINIFPGRHSKPVQLQGNFRRRKTYLGNLACLLADSYAGNG